MLQGTGITLPAVTGEPDSGNSIATAGQNAAPTATAPGTAPAAATSGTAGNYVVPAAPRPAPAPASPSTTASTAQPAPAAPATTAAQPAATQATTETPAVPATPAAAPAPTPAVELSIAFDPTSADIPASAKGALDGLAEKLIADESLRVVVNSYASASSEPSDDRESKARRMSLIRAINLRQYLFSKGVKATRLDIRALGSKVADVDRIDVVQAAPIQ
jgi:outer membrane protein OmpA-like peptidoglycan-associated protein